MYLGPTGDYESIYRLPPETCNDRTTARQMPYTHEANSDCPYHRGHPERRDKPLPPKVDKSWSEWGMYFELFASATADNTALEYLDEVRAFYLSQMLSQVTETNPPYAPSKDYGIWMRTESLGNVQLLNRQQKILILALAAWIVFLFIGIILL